MTAEHKTLVVPVLLITLGVGWLLTTLGIVPEVNWIWTLGLALTGILTFVMGGVDKVTVAVGPFFILASCLSVLRQTDRLATDTEVPILEHFALLCSQLHMFSSGNLLSQRLHPLENRYSDRRRGAAACRSVPPLFGAEAAHRIAETGEPDFRFQSWLKVR